MCQLVHDVPNLDISWFTVLYKRLINMNMLPRMQALRSLLGNLHIMLASLWCRVLALGHQVHLTLLAYKD